MTIKLGLIGNAISRSRAPSLHKMLAAIEGIELSYMLHDPGASTREAFAETLQQLRNQGYAGCNVTFPFKQLAVEFAGRLDKSVTEVSAANTLCIKAEEILAINTDYSGFIRGYRSRRGDQPAGEVLMLGAGGVGRAVAFGLFRIGGTHLYIYDLNYQSAASLATALNVGGYSAEAINSERIPETARKVQGLINCTPIGHYATPGNPLDVSLIGSQDWAFDAVYVPLETEFLVACAARGLERVSGLDLFFYQGVDAFEVFTGVDVNLNPKLTELKQDLFANIDFS